MILRPNPKVEKTFLFFKKKKTKIFTRDLVDSDYERFGYYASMISIMRLSEFVQSSTKQLAPVPIHSGVFAALHEYSHRKGAKCLLPNLREATLVLRLLDNCFMSSSASFLDCWFTQGPGSYLNCWFPQGLRSLTLEDKKLRSKLIMYRWKITVPFLVSNCSNIVTLNTGEFDFLEHTENFDLFLGLNKLENVRGSISSIHKEKIRLLGSLPSLKSIEGLILSQKTDITSFATADGLFQSMQDLQLHAPDWDTVAALFWTMNCRFKALDIQLESLVDVESTSPKDSEDLPTSHGFQNLTSAIASNTFLRESLKSITLTDKRGYELYAQLPSSTFQPFLSLWALQHVVLRMGDLERLNDAWLAEAALAWPDLRTLIIDTVDHCFSLKGLIPLLRKCRKVTTLEIHPTATHFDLSLLPADGSASNTNITGIFSLHKFGADEMDPEPLFRCLIAMFPNVTGVERADGTFSMDVDCSDELEEKWALLGQMFTETGSVIKG